MEYKNNIVLRKRQRKGVTALFLDITSGGRRKQESLKLYLVPELTRDDKRKNKETMQLAEAIRAERFTQLKKKAYDLDDPVDLGLYDFFDVVMREKTSNGVYPAGRTALKAYEPKNIRLSSVDVDWVRGFVRYLDTTSTGYDATKKLSQNTKIAYYSILRTVLREALKRRLIRTDPCMGVEGPKRRDCERQYLTLDELRRLAATPIPRDDIRRAFLFSCLTGLRLSDVTKMRWSEVSEVEGMTRLSFRQKKTGGVQYIDVNAEAVALMGARKKGSDPVFGSIGSPPQVCANISKWVAKAGIDKHITFHCARHTFATMLLTLGTDLYTVSKLLGHRQIQTTQIYAKIVDEKRREAVKKIPPLNI